MQQSTIKQLYAYWDCVRNGRIAPRRFEIEPAAIAPLLPETFIAECTGPSRYRFRLAGTKICHQFGRELRGSDLLSLWDDEDRPSITALLSNVFGEGAVGHALFQALARNGRYCKFELLLMPLTHSGEAINRALGAITAIDTPFWLGTEPMLRQELMELNLYWPDGTPPPAPNRHPPELPLDQFGALIRRNFTVYDGGLGKRD